MSKKTSNLKVCAEVQEEGVSRASAPPQMEVGCSQMRSTAVEMSTTDPRTQAGPKKNAHTERSRPLIRSRLDLITANKWRYKSLNSKIAGAVRQHYDESAPPQLHPVASNKIPSGRDMDSGREEKKIILF